MRAGLRVLGLLGGALAWAPFVGCDAFDPPAPPNGTGGLLGVGGVHATAGGSGGMATGGWPELCPGDSCCPEMWAIYSCQGDAVCKSYSYLATDCSKHECGAPCPFGCLDARCLPDPDAPTGGAGGLGGMGGSD